MKVVSTDGLTKLIQLIKSSFISNTETEQTMEIDTAVVSEVTLATVATTGDYDDLTNKPDLTAYALDANVVHLAGAETITGTKTFAGDGWITKIQNTDVTYNIAPSSNKSTSIIFTDKNGTQMGCVETMRYPSNNTLVRFNVYGANGNWASQALELMVDQNGNTTALAPASDADGSIVTTVNKSKAANGYFKLGNGLIAQWGFLNGGTSTSGTINFPTAFSSVNFRVVAVSNSRGVDVSISQESTTGCNWAKTSTDAYIKWIAIGY